MVRKFFLNKTTLFSRKKGIWNMLLALFSLLSSLHGYSQYQGHPILSKLEIFESGGKVHMSAMISAGNFCNGIDLERSTDGKNFQVVATEYGSCGNLMEAVTYTLTDAAPPKNQKLYYRMHLLGQGYTAQKTINLLGVEEWGYRITPNPASHKAIIHFENWNKAQVEIQIVNSAGQAVFNSTTNQDHFEIDINKWENGTYYFTLYNTIFRTKVKGKLVVENG
jgi:hypothetical protein